MIKRDKLEKSLKKKGFKEDRDGKHKRYVLFVNDIDMGIWTVTSHGSKRKDISGPLFSDIKNQLKLSGKELVGLAECSLSGEKYVELLRERGHI